MNLKKLLILGLCLIVTVGCGKKAQENKPKEDNKPKETYTAKISEVTDYELVQGGYPGVFFNATIYTNTTDILDQTRIKNIYVEMLDENNKKMVTIESNDSLKERWANKTFPVSDTQFSWSGYANLDSVEKQSSSWSHVFTDVEGPVHLVKANLKVTLDNGVILEDSIDIDVTRTLK